jgi:hypothetical protein
LGVARQPMNVCVPFGGIETVAFGFDVTSEPST